MFEKWIAEGRFLWLRGLWLTLFGSKSPGIRGRLGWLHRPLRGRTLLASSIVFGILFGFCAFIGIRDGFIPTSAPVVVKKQEPGATFTMALRDAIRAEDERGWMPNDILWPTVLLFNYQNFQLGELDVWRRVTYQLREHLSRVRTTDAINGHLDAANAALNNAPSKWWFPSFESKLQAASAELDAYARGLPERRDFSMRADNLGELIGNFASAMGNTQNQLAGNLPPHTSAGKVPAEGRMVSGEPRKELYGEGVGWFRSSATFYHAKGQAYAILIMMESIRIEFKDVLEKKNVLDLVDDSIFWLKEAISLQPWIVLDSGRASIFANHLDNFAAPFSQARAKLNSLADVLRNG